MPDHPELKPCPHMRGAECYRLTEHICAMPGRCGGRPTLCHTRMDVVHVIRGVARDGIDQWLEDFDNRYPREAVEECVRLGEVWPAAFWEEEYGGEPLPKTPEAPRVPRSRRESRPRRRRR